MNAKNRIIITDENSVSRYIIFINVLKDVEQKNHCIYKLVILKHAVLFINQINFDLNIKSWYLIERVKTLHKYTKNKIISL